MIRWVDDRTYVEHGKLSAMIIVALICAVITQAIGLHAVFGAGPKVRQILRHVTCSVAVVVPPQLENLRPAAGR